jgi:hypothetical protein
MLDVRLLELLESQWNRASLAQIEALGLSQGDVAYRVATGRLRAVHEGVFAGRPFLDDQRGRWMAATLTAPGTCGERGDEDEEDHERGSAPCGR